MAEEQHPPAKRTLIGRWLTSPITQAIGIFGVAFTIFQGLEPFLEFSRLVAYLVNHWRKLTRGLWEWLASLISLDLPSWALDLMTAIVFILLFTSRNLYYCITQNIDESVEKSFTMKIVAIGEKNKFMAIIAFILGFIIMSMLMYGIFIITIYLVVYPYMGVMLSSIISFLFGWCYFLLIDWIFSDYKIDDSIIVNSERVVLILIILFFFNYIAFYSHAIEDFIEKVTQ